jgi:hypothetical protein
MRDQVVLLKLLEKYKLNKAIEQFFLYIKRDSRRFQNTFTKGGNFKAVGIWASEINHKSGKSYLNHLKTLSLSEIAKELGI